MILVLYAPRSAERRHREARHVTRCEHVGTPTGSSVLVDEDAVIDVQFGLLGEVGTWNDPETGDNDVGFERSARAGRQSECRAVPSDLLDELFGQNFDALRTVVVVDEVREVGGEEAGADPTLRKDDVTSHPVEESAAATSEPMKPPPMTATRTPSSAGARALENRRVS
jgi:hypothetical protein